MILIITFSTNLALAETPQAPNSAPPIPSSAVAPTPAPQTVTPESSLAPDTLPGNAGPTSTPNGNDGRFKGMTPADGARKYFAGQFQSCDVLKTGKDVPGATSQDPKSLAGKGGPGCYQPNASALNYKLGGVGATFNSPVDLDKECDCSVFVSKAMGLSGLKLKPGGKLGDVSTTSGFGDIAKSVDSSCFELANDGVREGDILNAAGAPGHVVMVEKMGLDPFGINKLSSASGCATLNPSNFSFVIIHQSSSGGSITRAPATGGGSDVQAGLLQHAKAVCNAKFSNQSLKPQVYSGKKPFAVLRHLGDKKPGCTDKAPPIKGEQCVAQCTTPKPTTGPTNDVPIAPTNNPGVVN